MRRALVACVAALLTPPAIAMTLETEGRMLFASGELGNDLPAFEDALANPAIDTIVFVNSPGGDLWTGMRVGRLIASRGLVTAVVGRCLSACAIMFVGGRERRFADALRTAPGFLGVHGAHNRDTRQVDPQLQPQIYAFFRQQLGDRFDSPILNQALYEMDDALAMLIVPDPARADRHGVVHCRSGKLPRERCTPIPGVDALSLGFVTTREPLPVTLPARFGAPRR